MSKKAVLISYLAHNVVFNIAVHNPEGDVAILRGKFLLKFTDQTNVIFQRYDAVWDCDVDLNDDDEVHDKDRLKAIVSPAQAQVVHVVQGKHTVPTNQQKEKKNGIGDESEPMDTCDPQVTTDNQEIRQKRKKNDDEVKEKVPHKGKNDYEKSDVERQKDIIKQKCRGNKDAQGIAFIIGMFAKGTDKDVDNMASTLGKLNFTVYREQYLTSAQLCCLVKAASDCNYNHNYKYVVFYYSGHGGSDDSEKSFVLPQQDGGSAEVVYIMDDIIHPFVDSPKSGKFDRRYLFFFDCCLSYTHTEGGVTARDLESPLKFTKVPPECLVAYATSMGSKSAGGSEGGIWSRTLCSYLEKDLSLADILDKTREDVKNKFQVEKLDEKQLPQVSSNVSGVYLKDGVIGGFSIIRKSPNIFELHRLLIGISSKWPHIANALEVDPNFCQTLAQSVQLVDQDNIKLERVLRKWESSQCSPVTWEIIIKVLDFIGEKKTATNVSKHLKELEVIDKYRGEEDFQEFHLENL